MLHAFCLVSGLLVVSVFLLGMWNTFQQHEVVQDVCAVILFGMALALSLKVNSLILEDVWEAERQRYDQARTACQDTLTAHERLDLEARARERVRPDI